MARDRLGLFDTPPARQEVRLALAVVALLLAAPILVWPVRDVRVGAVVAFVPMINAVMLVAELIIAALLYGQAAIFRSRALAVLASGYVFAALLLAPHALTFPGAFTPTGLLGAGINTTAWLSATRRLAFPIAIAAYALLKRTSPVALPAGDQRPAGVLAGLIIAILLALATTLMTTVGHDLLPPFFVNQRDALHSNLIILNSLTILLVMLAAALLIKRIRSVLDMWLLVAMCAWLVQSVMNLPLTARYTVGWYSLFGVMMMSSLVVMLALITDANRLYARLVLSKAVANRERDARLMSMEAVAAAVAHEVGQPLAAVNLNAAAGLQWLDRKKPHVELAIKSLQETLDAGHRSFDVVKSIRAMFSNGLGSRTEFDLNELVRETTSLLHRELAAKRVSVQFALADVLPPVVANRIQIQRVLINLLTNAIESISTGGRRTGTISIRSAALVRDCVLLEVSDSGDGLAPETMEHVFDPFFSTKSRGTGLGLSLSRTIIEEHAGRLWVSEGAGFGATFHVQLPCKAA